MLFVTHKFRVNNIHSSYNQGPMSNMISTRHGPEFKRNMRLINLAIKLFLLNYLIITP